MFTMIGNLIYSSCNNRTVNPQRASDLFFPQQKYFEVADMIIGLVACIIGAILIANGSTLQGVAVMGITCSTLYVYIGNIVAAIKSSKCSGLDNRSYLWNQKL
jgi:hypothetical protein